jgi:hypothetical protein
MRARAREPRRPGRGGRSLIVGDLAEIDLVDADRIERIGRAEADDLVGLVGEEVERLVGATGTARMRPAGFSRRRGRAPASARTSIRPEFKAR